MSLILSLDTSTKVCSVALHQQGALLAQSAIFLQQSHSVMLTRLIEQMIQGTNHSLKDIDAIALSKGPGSYTGLRIGTSTAKGLCYALDKPLIAINTLEAMAHSIQQVLLDDYWLCPMIDARRMEVYCAIYDRELNNQLPTQAKIIDETSFQDFLLHQKIAFFGNGSNKCKSVFKHQNQAYFIDGIHPSAISVGKLADKYFENQAFEDLVYFEPYYLKDFISTSQIKKKQ